MKTAQIFHKTGPVGGKGAIPGRCELVVRDARSAGGIGAREVFFTRTNRPNTDVIIKRATVFKASMFSTIWRSEVGRRAEGGFEGVP